jgi:hypothetical protein
MVKKRKINLKSKEQRNMVRKFFEKVRELKMVKRKKKKMKRREEEFFTINLEMERDMVNNYWKW